MNHFVITFVELANMIYIRSQLSYHTMRSMHKSISGYLQSGFYIKRDVYLIAMANAFSDSIYDAISELVLPFTSKALF